MLDPTFKIRKQSRRHLRRGAIAPLFAVICPILLIFSGFAINLAYMQLVSTELKIATDATCHAGGRAMSLRQIKDPNLSNQENIQNAIDAIVEQAELTAQANKVGGKVLSVGADDNTPSQIQLTFGRSIRGNNGYGMYEFTPLSLSDIQNGNKRPSSLAVSGSMPTSTVFRMFAYKKRIGGESSGGLGPAGGSSDNKQSHGTWQGGSQQGFLQSGLNDFTPTRRSIATQVDRDIALVLDRSGSMLFYQDEDALEDRIWDLYNTTETIEEPGYWKYHYWKWSNWYGYWRDKGYHKQNHQPWGSQVRNWNDKQWQNGSSYQQRLISSSERSDAHDSLYRRDYSNNVIYQLEKWTNPNHTLGSSYHSSERNELTDPMAKYCADWEYSNQAPEFSRWDFLDRGVTAFLDVLDETDQEELVSLVTFNSNATLDLNLQETYGDVRTEVASIFPNGGTAIGTGMTTGLPPIVSGAASRPFAAKTIIVLTDGENNAGEDPEDAVEDIIGQHNVTIHTVTFSKGADKDAMAAVAVAGRGRHYHTDDGEQLVPIFEEIANNLPTILTE